MQVLAHTLVFMVALTLEGASCRADGASHASPQSGGGGDTLRVKVSFERTGGVAGMRLRVTIDSDTLTAEQARELRRLIDEAGFFDLPAEIVDTAPQPDRFQYWVSLESGGRRHAVRVTEAAAPAKLNALLDWLTRAAPTARRRQ